MDIKKLLQELEERTGSSSSSSSSKNRVLNDATEQQQADELLTSLSAFASPTKFKPGDFVRYRKEMHDIIRNWDRLHMVYEAIDPPVKAELSPETYGDPTTYRKYDVIIGVSSPKAKGSILKYAADSRDLEYWPDGERLKRQGTA